MGSIRKSIISVCCLRTTAQRLGVKFYCPHWKGDDIFCLNDQEERAYSLEGIDKIYKNPNYKYGFDPKALNIEDGTEITGQFQTEKYFNPEKIRAWYTFREEGVAKVREKYQGIDFAKSVGVHLRLGDILSDPYWRSRYYVPSVEYYRKALSMFQHRETILVFSDQAELAKKYLSNLKFDIMYIEDNQMHEDLYLMTQCHDLISSASTFSWWGAWMVLVLIRLMVFFHKIIGMPWWSNLYRICLRN